MGIPMIELLIKRLSFSKKINQIIVAIPKNKKNNKLNNFLNKKKYHVFRGSEKYVLKRFFNAAKLYKADIVVRITGDCPLIEPSIVDKVIQLYERKKVDYCSNVNPRTFPKGLDVEVFSRKALEFSFKEAKKNEDFEHVNTVMRKSKKIKKANLFSKKKLSNIRITLDEKIDLQVIKKVLNYFKNNLNFTYKELSKLLKNKPKLFRFNSHLNRS